jgi:hypothetical protein
VPEATPATGCHESGTCVTLADFLAARLTEELALLWERDRSRTGRWTGPSLAAQVAVIDEHLTTLSRGLLPPTRELRIMLYGYGAHPDYDPHWARQLSQSA